MLLDVTRLPRQALYGPEGRRMNLASIVLGMANTVDDWSRLQALPNDGTLVKPNDSFGFAMAKPDAVDGGNWDDPYDFVWFVAGWGPEGNRYIANAVRKLRALLRTGHDTLQLRLRFPEYFKDQVGSSSGANRFEWGDFADGGAKLVSVGYLRLPCAVSALREVEDDSVAGTIGGHIGATMLKLDHPELAL